MQIVNLEVKNLGRHSVHEKLNVEKDISMLGSLEASTNEYGKVVPVLVVNVEDEGIQYPQVVDGWSSVLVARNSGQETLPCILIDGCPEDELPNLVASIHSNYHNDPEEDYKRFKYFYDRLVKGQGYRSDLNSSIN